MAIQDNDWLKRKYLYKPGCTCLPTGRLLLWNPFGACPPPGGSHTSAVWSLVNYYFKQFWLMLPAITDNKSTPIQSTIHVLSLKEYQYCAWPWPDVDVALAAFPVILHRYLLFHVLRKISGIKRYIFFWRLLIIVYCNILRYTYHYLQLSIYCSCNGLNKAARVMLI